jgi:2-oxo-3-hexenedioate decarboxylase
MSTQSDVPDLDVVATDVVAALATHRQIDSFARSSRGLSVADAYRVTAMLRAAFAARGEKVIGRKIGFTNRHMWAAYGVRAPIWGYCTDRTTFELTTASVQYVSDFAEPRIEPEIVFGLGKTPSPDMDALALLGCIDWVALGFEIVQSIFTAWKFTAADTIAANALHGALLVGQHHAIAPRNDVWRDELASFGIELYCNGKLSEIGGGSSVLGSPLLALHHLVQLLAKDPHNPPLSAGEMVSTGTLTLAQPIAGGETWTARVHGIPLDDVTLRIAT